MAEFYGGVGANRYDVILLNPQTHPQAKQAPARSLGDWLASPEGQTSPGNRPEAMSL